MTPATSEIEFDFFEDAAKLATNVEFYRTRQRRILDHLWFRFSVRFRIRNAEFFCDEGRWIQLPLLQVAGQLQYACRVAWQRGSTEFQLAEGGVRAPLLLSRLDGEHLEVSRPDIGLQESVRFVDLIASLEAFAAEVRSFLLAACPALATDELWHAWFAGDDLNGRTV